MPVVYLYGIHAFQICGYKPKTQGKKKNPPPNKTYIYIYKKKGNAKWHWTDMRVTVAHFYVLSSLFLTWFPWWPYIQNVSIFTCILSVTYSIVNTSFTFAAIVVCLVVVNHRNGNRYLANEKINILLCYLFLSTLKLLCISVFWLLYSVWSVTHVSAPPDIFWYLCRLYPIHKSVVCL